LPSLIGLHLIAQHAILPHRNQLAILPFVCFHRFDAISQDQMGHSRMPHKENDGNPRFRVTGEPRHWIEYGVFAFVIITAVATATAAWYTRREWESSADNGRRQLRAYVFPDQANLVWGGTAKPTAAEIVIKNSGQTPAYRLATTAVISVTDYPLQADLRIPLMPDNHTVVPPAGSHTLSVTMAQLLTGDQIEAIQKGTQAIYVFGEISYADAFGECRTTGYRFFYTGGGGDIGSRVGLSYLDEGNTEAPCPKAK
jgi:hypothetical protein